MDSFKRLFNSLSPVVLPVSDKLERSVSAKSPLGIFWDIENCPIPHNKSPSDVVKHIRHHIDARHPECGFAKEFFVVADTLRLDQFICDSLDRNGVTVIHVNGAAKNAADDKLQELMDMFVDKFGAGAVLTVITSDINLVRTIRNARRKDVVVVLIHGTHASDDLKNTANESYLYDDVIRGAHTITQIDKQLNPAYLKVSNLPKEVPSPTVINRLSQLSANCGGKVESVDGEEAVIRFGCKDDAQRAAQRMAGVDCFGHIIDVKLMDAFVFKTALNITKVNTKDDCKSVIKGLVIKHNENALNLVRKLVMDWNDPQIDPNIISYVDRVGRDNERLTLFVKANSPQNNNLLVSAAKQHLNPLDGIEWLKYIPKPKPIKSKNYIKRESNATQYDEIDRKSVIKGLETKIHENVTQTVRQLVMSWSDNTLTGDLIIDVKRDMRCALKDRKALLFVMAMNPEANTALVNGANKYLRSKSGIIWSYYTPKQRHNSEADSKSVVNDKNIPQMVVSNDCKSVIIGLDTNGKQNKTKLVRKLVMDWKDSQISANFIVNVEVFPGVGLNVHEGLNTCPPLLVTASSAANCQALMAGARRYMTGQQFNWSSYF